VKFVNRGLGKVETILKTAMSPHEPFDMFIDHYFLLIGDRHLGNFQRILELKGLKRTEQQQMVDAFLKKQTGMENLQENSTVMSVLQGMPAQISAQGVVGPSAGLAGNMAGLGLAALGSGPVAGLMTPGGPGTGGAAGGGKDGSNNPYQLSNIVTSSILSHSPFAALAAQHLNSNSPGGGAHSLGGDLDTGSGLGVGQGGQQSAGQAGGVGGSFAAGAKINVNIRKFVAGIRAKKDQDPGAAGGGGGGTSGI
jgi:hypothetical protein